MRNRIQHSLDRFQQNLGGPRTVPANISGSRIFASGWSAAGLAIMIACAFGSFVVSGGGTLGIALAAVFLALAPVVAAVMGVGGNYIGRWRDNVAMRELVEFNRSKAIDDEAKLRCQADLEKVQVLATFFIQDMENKLPPEGFTQKKIFKRINNEMSGLSEDGQLYALIFKRAFLLHEGELSTMHEERIMRAMRPLRQEKLQRIKSELKEVDEAAQPHDVESGLMYQELKDDLEGLSLDEELALFTERMEGIEKRMADAPFMDQFRYYFYDRDLAWIKENLLSKQKNESSSSMPEASSEKNEAELVRAEKRESKVAKDTIQGPTLFPYPSKLEEGSGRVNKIDEGKGKTKTPPPGPATK